MGATFAILDCRPAVRIDEGGSHRGQEPQEGASHVHRRHQLLSSKTPFSYSRHCESCVCLHSLSCCSGHEIKVGTFLCGADEIAKCDVLNYGWILKFNMVNLCLYRIGLIRLLN